MEEQRIIWLAQGRLGLIDEICKILPYGTFYTLRMALRWTMKMTTAPPNDVQRNQMEQVPLPYLDEGEGNEIRVAQFVAKSPEVRK